MSEPQDFAAQAREIVDTVQDNFGLPVGAPEMLRRMISHTLRAAFASGRRAGLLEAAQVIENAPYATATWKGDGSPALYWERDALTLMLRDIRALAGRPPREGA